MALRTDIISRRYDDDRVPLDRPSVVQQEEIARYIERVAGKQYRIVEVGECTICGCSDGTVVARKDRYGIPMETVVCDRCGLIYSKDLLDADSFRRFYTEQYRDMYEGVRFSLDAKDLDSYFCARGLGPRFTANIIALSGLRPGATILEIGTGGGWNLLPFKERGFTVRGYDYDDRFLDAGRRRGLDLRRGSIGDAIRNGDRADLVLLVDVIEHLVDPVGDMKEIKKLLNKGGGVFIKTPGLKASYYGRAEGDFLGNLQNAHLFLFEKATLQMLMQKAGFQPVVCGEQIFGLFRPVDHPTGGFPESVRRGSKVVKNLKRLERMQPYWGGLYNVLKSRGRSDIYDKIVHGLGSVFNARYTLQVLMGRFCNS